MRIGVCRSLWGRQLVAVTGYNNDDGFTLHSTHLSVSWLLVQGSGEKVMVRERWPLTSWTCKEASD